MMQWQRSVLLDRICRHIGDKFKNKNEERETLKVDCVKCSTLLLIFCTRDKKVARKRGQKVINKKTADIF